MSLQIIPNELLSSALEPESAFSATRRDATLPEVPNKAHAVIGMRRTGKTTFLRQLQKQWRSEVKPERVVLLGFDDDRLSDITVEQLDYLLEEYYRRYPEWRRKETVCGFWTRSSSCPDGSGLPEGSLIRNRSGLSFPARPPECSAGRCIHHFAAAEWKP